MRNAFSQHAPDLFFGLKTRLSQTESSFFRAPVPLRFERKEGSSFSLQCAFNCIGAMCRRRTHFEGKKKRAGNIFAKDSLGRSFSFKSLQYSAVAPKLLKRRGAFLERGDDKDSLSFPIVFTFIGGDVAQLCHSVARQPVKSTQREPLGVGEKGDEQ